MRIKQARLSMASLAGIALLIGCTYAQDRAYDNAALSDMIFVATVDLASEAIISNEYIYASFDVSEKFDSRGRCCLPANNDFRVDKQGVPKTAEEIMAVLDDEASLFTITLPDPSDTSLIEPLFGKKMYRHMMTKPQRGCVVVSGVRDGVLRAGVIAHEVSIPRKAGYSIDELDDDAVDLCIISAVLLLHGFPIPEAMDHATYTKKDDLYNSDIIPNFEKIRTREAEILAQREK